MTRYTFWSSTNVDTFQNGVWEILLKSHFLTTGWWVYLPWWCLQSLWCWCRLCHDWWDVCWTWRVGWRPHWTQRQETETVLWDGIFNSYEEIRRWSGRVQVCAGKKGPVCRNTKFCLLQVSHITRWWAVFVGAKCCFKSKLRVNDGWSEVCWGCCTRQMSYVVTMALGCFLVPHLHTRHPCNMSQVVSLPLPFCDMANTNEHLASGYAFVRWSSVTCTS